MSQLFQRGVSSLWPIGAIQMNKNYQAILSALPVRFNTLLDVCCGDGELISLISEKFQASFTGVEDSEKKIAIARDRKIPNAEFFVGNQNNLYFKDGSFDVVVSPLPIYAYKDIFRVISPSCGVLITAVDTLIADMEPKVLKGIGFSEAFLKGDLLIAKK